MQANTPYESDPTKFMDGKNPGVKLKLVLIDSNYAAVQANEGEVSLKPQAGHANDPNLYSCRSADLITFLAAPYKLGSLKVIDVRNASGVYTAQDLEITTSIRPWC